MLTSALSLQDLQSIVYASTGGRLYAEYVAPGLPKKAPIENLLIALENVGTTECLLTRHHRTLYCITLFSGCRDD